MWSRRSRRYLRQSPDRDGKGEHPHRYSVHGSHLLGRCHGRLQATSPTRYRPTLLAPVAEYLRAEGLPAAATSSTQRSYLDLGYCFVIMAISSRARPDGAERMLTGLDMPPGRQPQAGQPVIAQQHAPGRPVGKQEVRDQMRRRKFVACPAGRCRRSRPARTRRSGGAPSQGHRRARCRTPGR